MTPVLRDETGEADALNCAGHIHFHRNEFGLSLRSAEDALALHRHLGNRPGVVEALFHISDACRNLDRHDEASRAWDEATAIQADLQGLTPGACS